MSQQVPNLTQRRNGIWETRIQIPKDVQAAYGKTVEHVSHGTRDFATALERHGPLAARVKRKIDAIRSGLPAQQPPAQTHALWSPDDAHAAIQRWTKATIDKAYLDHFHGLVEPMSPFGDEAVAHSERIMSLRESRFADVADFDFSLVEAVSTHGIAITAGHPAIPRLRGWFAEACLTVESHLVRFRLDDFSGWSLNATAEPSASPVAGSATQPAPTGSLAATKLSELLNTYIEVAVPNAKTESEMRGYTRRLIEHLGDIAIGDLKPPMFDGFLVKLRKFPVTKRPDIMKRPFDEIVALYGDDQDMPKVGGKTIRVKWFGCFNQLANFAVSRTMITANPVTPTIPKKADDNSEERDPWSADQIKAMFSKPLFTGCASLAGNRDEPGKLVEKDAKWWLPVLGLWTGMRLDELGAMRTDELKRDAEHDVWYFDLTERPLKGPRRVKNPQSKRRVPVHQKLIDLGFITYAEKQSEWLFPELPHDGTESGDTTKQWSKWFGRWWRANGLLEEGLKTDFHSFRHNFKSACFAAEIGEDVHDMLTGHAGTGNQKVSRGYVSGEIGFLSKAMNKVDFPTFKMSR